MSRNPAEQFKKLQEKWYAKLDADGFEDIERNERELKQYSQNVYRERNDSTHSTWIEAKSDYYRMAEHFLNEHKFGTRSEKYIWEQHSQGVSFRKIAVKIKSRGVKSDKSSVGLVVKRLKDLMFLKYGVIRG